MSDDEITLERLKKLEQELEGLRAVLWEVCEQVEYITECLEQLGN